MRDVAVNSGVPNFDCSHTELIRLDTPTAEAALNLEVLDTMVKGTALSSAVRDDLLALHASAQTVNAPLAAVWPYGRTSRVLLSVFTGIRCNWSLFGRVLVTCSFSGRGSLRCECPIISCRHRAVMRWYLAQNHPVVPGAKFVEAVDEEGPVAPTQPDSVPELDFGAVALYQLGNKKMPLQIPREQQDESGIAADLVLIPAETECHRCGSRLSAPSVVSRQATALLYREPGVVKGKY